jgi:hypothetical protein
MDIIRIMRRGLRNLSIAFCAFIFFFLYLTAAAGAATIYVSPSGNNTFGTGTFSNPYKSVAKGIQRAAAFDVVQLDYGTYSELTTGDTFPLMMKNNVTVRGMGFADSVVMGNGIDSVFIALNVNGIVLEDLTVTGGAEAGINLWGVTGRVSRCRLTGNSDGYGGGASFGLNSPDIIFESNIVDNNVATISGAGICVEPGTTAAIINCTIYGNYIPVQDGMTHGPGVANYSSTTVLFNNIIWNNWFGDSVFGSRSEEYYAGAVPNIPPTCNIIESGNFYGGSGNSTSNPVFIDAGAGDFRVQKSPPSAAIDTGVGQVYANSRYYYAPGTDIIGAPRPAAINFLNYDMGAYEANNDIDLPTGSVSINNGDPSTTSADVVLGLDAVDTGGSGLSRMRFSNNGTDWSPWREYAATWPYWSVTDPAYGGNSSDGTKTVYAQFIDHAGNLSDVASDTIVLNPTPPSGTVAIDTAVPGYTTTEAVNLTLTAVDASGFGLITMQMAFSNDGSIWSAWEPYSAARLGWNLVTGAGGSSGDGSKTVYVKFKDGAGSESAPPPALASVVLDTTKPTDPTVSITGAPVYVTSPLVSLDVSAVDADIYGVSKMSFSNDGSAWSDWEDYGLTRAGWDLTATAFGGSADSGSKNVYARFMDPAGNVSDPSAAAAVIYDGADPTGTIEINGGAVYTTNSLVDLAMTVSPAVPGQVRMLFSNDSDNWSDPEAFQATKTDWDLINGRGGSPGDGLKFVYVRFIDVYGRESSLIFDSITLDSTAPVNPVIISSSHSVSVWSSDNTVDVSWSGATDATSSVSGVSYEWSQSDSTVPDTVQDSAGSSGATTSPVLADSNSWYFHLRTKDTVGNWSAPSHFGPFFIDTAAPIGGGISINGGNPTTNHLLVSLSLPAVDALSGIYTMSLSNNGSTWDSDLAYSASLTNWDLSSYGGSSAAGTKTVYVKYKDLAGNETSVYTASISYEIIRSSLLSILYSYTNSARIWNYDMGLPAPVPSQAWYSGLGFDASRAQTTVADFDNDGKQEAAVLYDYGGGVARLWTIKIEEPNPVPVMVWQSAPGTFFAAKCKITSGDYDGDSKAEVALMYDYDGSTRIWTIKTTVPVAPPVMAWFSGPGCDAKRIKMVSGDYDGDHKSEIAMMYDYGSSITRIWTIGLDVSSPVPTVAWYPGPGNCDATKAKISSGDYDGDGKVEVAVLYDYGNSTARIWTIGLDSFPFQYMAWYSGPGNCDASKAKISSGDFDSDSKDEIALLYNYGNSTARLWTMGLDLPNPTPYMAWYSGPGFDFTKAYLPAE